MGGEVQMDGNTSGKTAKPQAEERHRRAPQELPQVSRVGHSPSGTIFWWGELLERRRIGTIDPPGANRVADLVAVGGDLPDLRWHALRDRLGSLFHQHDPA